MSLPSLVRVALAAALLAGAGATAASAETGPPGGGPCHIYHRPPVFDHGIDGLPPVPGQPYLYCDY